MNAHSSTAVRLGEITRLVAGGDRGVFGLSRGCSGGWKRPFRRSAHSLGALRAQLRQTTPTGEVVGRHAGIASK